MTHGLNDENRINGTPGMGLALARWLSMATLIVACGSAGPTATGSTPSSTRPSPLASSSPSPEKSATSSPSSSGDANVVYVLAPTGGSTASGFVTKEPAADGVRLKVTVSGLNPGGSYLADADPLPCLLFTGGPSQAFAKAFTADSNGKAAVVWTVPQGMTANANIQELRNGRFVVLACADLRGA